MKISNKQALDLEIKLNKSIYKKKWNKLGDLLYSWRLNPLYYKIKSPLSYCISENQYKWINENIISDSEEFKCYELTKK
uniref:Uncharacterized protein n=1 Tax=Mimiviridae sp. ChoanoV1 TaxID=2596887 RepID=A0A5B8INQ2_9VIRU|nr:hypothetical protein 1_76 [Mimiviridae sp. ChoanoV1]